MKIFLSYSREDREFAELLRQDLIRLHHDVWIDQNLLGGQNWWDEILLNIRQCDIFVLALSPNSIESEACLLELRYAQATNRPFIPAMVLPTNPNQLPPELLGAQYIDYTGDRWACALDIAAALSNHPLTPPLPDPLPPPPTMPQPELYEARQLIALSNELDYEHQTRLVEVLLKSSHRPRLRGEVLELLEEFRNRRDVMKDVLKRLDDLSASLKAMAPQPLATQPVPAPPPPVPPPAAGPRRTWRWVAAGLAGLIVAAVALVAVLKLTSSATSAAGAVAAASADRLTLSLLQKGLVAGDLPADVSPSSPELLDYRSTGLVAEVHQPLSGPANSMGLDYFVFDDPGDASAYFTGTTALPGGFQLSGHFATSGIADSSKCGLGTEAATSSQPAESAGSCLVLSSKVVSYVYVLEDGLGTINQPVVSGLALDLVRHLSSVAGATSGPAPGTPPGHLSAAGLFDALLHSSPSASPVLRFITTNGDTTTGPANAGQVLYGGSPPPGLVNSSRVSLPLSGQDLIDNISFYVFSSAADAASWYSSNLSPTYDGSRTARTGTVDSSGFSQTTNCADYAPPSGSVGYGACYVLWGDVVMSALDAISTTSSPAEGDNAEAVTFARAGTLYLAQVAGL